MNPSTIELAATILFAVAILHTFLVSKFQRIAHKYTNGSPKHEFFEYLGEVEAVFGFWAAIFLLFMFFLHGNEYVINYLEGTNFTEPAFVFVIMAMAATRPVIKFSEKIIISVSKILPFQKKMSFFVATLVVGPLLGSFITEPAAMTVTAIILEKNFFSKKMSTKFKYATIGLLFVAVSVGGTLTHFAAPPVLMVASKWGWGMGHMLEFFGYKSFLSILISTLVIAFYFKAELTGDFKLQSDNEEKIKPTWWITLFHIVFLALVVLYAHHMVVFLGLFLFFMAFVKVTNEYQDRVQVKEALMVGFFLGGLVTLGGLQAWWLKPLLASLGEIPLYLGATALTGITDNAALTYLGSLGDLTESKKYFLLAGAVAGGGLTVIANAPNPAGFGILKGAFGKDGISPLGLLKAALIPTAIVLISFYFLPNITF